MVEAVGLGFGLSTIRCTWISHELMAVMDCVFLLLIDWCDALIVIYPACVQALLLEKYNERNKHILEKFSNKIHTMI